ncbi:MAG TPA: hypothetical protein QF836_01700 [Nitrospinota bacterium]|nr:hypothetical protein [Nitrospinota bacterium]
MKNNNPSVLVIGDHQGYLEEQFYIEGLSYFCCSGNIQSLKKNQTELVILIKREIHKEDEIVLKNYLNQNGKLVIVHPSDQICRLFDFKIKGYLNSGYFTCVSKNFPKYFYPIFNVVQLKINKESKPICTLLDENKNHSGYDSIFQINLSKGCVVVIAFDLFKTFYQITHGKDVSYENRESPILRVDDGRMIEESQMNMPVADIMRSVVVNLILDLISYPAPRLWYFPDGCRSALCVTHDSDNANSIDVTEINKIDKELDVCSTTFMSIFNGGIKSWRKFIFNGHDLQFHPVQLYKYHPGKILNVLQRKIGSTKWFLKFQQLFFIVQKFLFDILAGKTTKGIRFHGLQWNKITDQPLWMSTIKTDFDSTLGSNYYYGYPYGTGLPYFLKHPKDYRNLNVLEIPMHIMDSVFVKKHGPKKWIKVFFKVAKQFISEANSTFFSLTVINLHHFILLDNLDPIKNCFPQNNEYISGSYKKEVLENYREFINYSKKLNIKVESMSYLNKFWRKRREVQIGQPAWDNEKKELHYQIALNDNNYIYSQILPFKYKKAQLKKIVIGEVNTDFKTIMVYNVPYAIFQIQRGPISLSVKAKYS